VLARAASAGFGIFCKPSLPATLLASVSSDIQEMGDHALPDRGNLYLAEFERQSGSYVRLLSHGLTDEELTCLAVVIREASARSRRLAPCSMSANGVKPRCGEISGSFAKGIRLVIGASDRIAHGHLSVLLEVGERAFGCIDRYVGEVGASQALSCVSR